MSDGPEQKGLGTVLSTQNKDARILNKEKNPQNKEKDVLVNAFNKRVEGAYQQTSLSTVLNLIN